MISGLGWRVPLNVKLYRRYFETSRLKKRRLARDHRQWRERQAIYSEARAIRQKAKGETCAPPSVTPAKTKIAPS